MTQKLHDYHYTTTYRHQIPTLNVLPSYPHGIFISGTGNNAVISLDRHTPYFDRLWIKVYYVNAYSGADYIQLKIGEIPTTWQNGGGNAVHGFVQLPVGTAVRHGDVNKILYANGNVGSLKNFVVEWRDNAGNAVNMGVTPHTAILTTWFLWLEGEADSKHGDGKVEMGHP